MSALRRIRHWVRRWVRHPEAELSRRQRAARYAVRLAAHAAEQLRRDRAPLMAAAITYRTVFAIIPVLVVSLVMLRFFFGADAISQGLQKIFEYFGLTELAIDSDGPPSATGPGEGSDGDGAAVSPDSVAEWLESLVQRVEGINFGAVGAVGALLLAYAALSLLMQVEQCFNVVYRAPSGRRIVMRLTSYWTMLTLGPIGLIASFAAGDRLAGALRSLGVLGAGAVDAVLSVAISWLLLLIAYLLIPNTTVRLRPALIGSLVAAILWEAGKSGFRAYLGLSTGYSALYGSLGLVPVFFLWVYITWLVVIFGLELSHAIQTLGRSGREGRSTTDAMSAVDPACVAAVMIEAVERFRTGKRLTVQQASDAAEMPADLAERVLGRLVEEGFLHRVDRGEDGAGFTLARPPERISAAEMLSSAYGAQQRGDTDGGAIDRLRAARLDRVRGISLADLAGDPASGA